ncbi:MAG: hypothetical protein E7020_05205 [Alphaproteobacteria bacterium]|nr:hypothetical protein [Alphaproteobacteria bacterium]
MNIIESIQQQNQLRKIKKEVNRIALPNKAIAFLKKCYGLVADELKLIESQYEFSRQIMNTNQFYYAKMICEGKSPSISCISTIVENIKTLKELPNLNKSILKQIDALYDEGQQIIYQKLLK